MSHHRSFIILGKFKRKSFDPSLPAEVGILPTVLYVFDPRIAQHTANAPSRANQRVRRI
jgi:hypothetical protein